MSRKKSGSAFGPHVFLGKKIKMETGVWIGNRPGRNIKDDKTVIGDLSQIRMGTLVYAGTRIGKKLETGHYVVIREANRIGDHVSIWNHSVVDYGCKIGNHVKIHNHVYLAQYTVVEDDVFIGPGTVTTNDKYIVLKSFPGPLIHKGARVGAGVVLLPGVHVGSRSLIGSGSVVTQDIPDGVVAYGNPARVHGSIEAFEAKRQDSIRSFK